MVKASNLLKSQQFTHCIAHSLHLLIVNDGLNRVQELKDLIEKCNEIVTSLHFKRCNLKDENLYLKDRTEMDNIMEKINSVITVVEVDSNYSVVDNIDCETDEAVSDKHHTHSHVTLKKPVITR